MAAILGSAVVFLDGTVVNVALPAIREDLDTGLAAQQWIVEAYLLTLGALILVGGSLGDLLGRRRVFVAGLIGFGVTSALCAMAPTAEVLVAARTLQGIAGALLVPASLALVTATFPGAERGAAIGSWTAWTGMAFVIGPLGGGALIEFVSWRWIFAINVPLVLVTLAMARAGAGESRRGGVGEDRLPGRGARVARPGRAGVRADRAAAVRLDRPARLDPRDRRPDPARRVPLARAPHGPPDAAAVAVQVAELRGRQRRDPADLRRARRGDVLRDDLPPAGERATARSRPACR